MIEKALILPGDPLYYQTLATARPPDWRRIAEKSGENCAYVAGSEDGILRAVPLEGLIEYAYGGEYDDRLEILKTEDYELEFFGDVEPPDQLEFEPSNNSPRVSIDSQLDSSQLEAQGTDRSVF